MANPKISILINAKDRASSVFEKLKKNAGSIAATIAGYFSVRFFASATEDAQKLEEQMGTLEAVIKSTGEAAGLTADDIVQMSKRLDEQTLGSAESFRTAATSLLTFKSVSHDAFETTLSLAQDLASAGFGTLETNAIQLGKALEDPVKGLNSLSRSGVTFAASERELIKTLVETGQQAKAQGIILEALANQVGGAGAGAGGGLSGAIDLVGKRMTDFKEKLGKGMIAPLTQVNGVVADFIQRLNDSGGVQAFGERIGTAFLSAAQFAQSLFSKINEVYSTLNNAGVIAEFKARFSGAITSVKDLVGQLAQSYTALYSTLADASANTTFAEAFSSVLINTINSVTLFVTAFTTGLSIIETAFHTLLGIGQSFFSSISQSVADFEALMSRVTFGGVAERWQAEAAKSQQAADGLAASMTESFAKAEVSFNKTAENAAKTQQAFSNLVGETKVAAQATRDLAGEQQKSNETMNQAAQSAGNLAETVTNVAAAQENASGASITFGRSLDVVSDKADSAASSVSNYQKELNQSATQGQHFRDLLANEASQKSSGKSTGSQAGSTASSDKAPLRTVQTQLSDSAAELLTQLNESGREQLRLLEISNQSRRINQASAEELIRLALMQQQTSAKQEQSTREMVREIGNMQSNVTVKLDGREIAASVMRSGMVAR